MWLESNNAEIKHLLLKNIIVADKINEDMDNKSNP